MSLTAAPEVFEADPEDPECRCLICSGDTPERAYRPHTLDGDCWCCFKWDGRRVTATCWLPKAYPAL